MDYEVSGGARKRGRKQKKKGGACGGTHGGTHRAKAVTLGGNSVGEKLGRAERIIESAKKQLKREKKK